MIRCSASATDAAGTTCRLTVIVQGPLNFIQMRVRHDLVRHQHRLWKYNHFFPRDGECFFLFILADRQEPHTAGRVDQDDADWVRRMCAGWEERLDQV